jgi:hypothetical protein
VIVALQRSGGKAVAIIADNLTSDVKLADMNEELARLELPVLAIQRSLFTIRSTPCDFRARDWPRGAARVFAGGGRAEVKCQSRHRILY